MLVKTTFIMKICSQGSWKRSCPSIKRLLCCARLPVRDLHRCKSCNSFLFPIYWDGSFTVLQLITSQQKEHYINTRESSMYISLQRIQKGQEHAQILTKYLTGNSTPCFHSDLKKSHFFHCLAYKIWQVSKAPASESLLLI